MRYRNPIRHRPRRGLVVLECALVYPLVILLFVGMIVIGMGVYHYEHVATLSSEGARWASVRGWQYEHDLNPLNQADLPQAATADDVRDYVVGRASGLEIDSNDLGVQVNWNSSNKLSHALLDGAGNPQVDGNGSIIEVSNTITVTVTYRWIPGTLFGGAFLLKSTTTVPMFY